MQALPEAHLKETIIDKTVDKKKAVERVTKRGQVAHCLGLLEGRGVGMGEA